MNVLHLCDLLYPMENMHKGVGRASNARINDLPIYQTAFQ